MDADLLMRRSIHGVGEQSSPCLTGRFGRCVFVGEHTEMARRPVHPNLSSPFPEFLVPVDASVRGRCSTMGAAILVAGATFARDDAQIGSAIIELVPVDVVALALIVVGHVEQLTMKADGHHAAVNLLASDSVPVLGMPAPLVRPRSIRAINNGMRDHAATGGQRNQRGIIDLHRSSPSVGVTPPDVASIAGASCCSNYTPYQIGGAA